MLLELVNFRCWKKRSFTFPDHGLILLNGVSGSGKSSILNAIHFVLYGIGTKVVSNEEKKCSVRFVYNNHDITRSKGPNRLLLECGGIEYEDEIAQQIINSHFGTNFLLTSYVTQKMVSSFLNLGPNDKMSFLEQLALGEQDITNIKKKTKDNIREKKEKMLQKIGQLEVLSKEVSEMKKPEEVSFPLGGKFNEIKIKNESIYWKRTIKSLQESLKKKGEIEKIIASENIKLALFQKQTKITDEYSEKLDKITDEFSSEKSKYKGDEIVSSLKAELQFLKNKREFANINNRYIEEKKNFDNLLKQEIESLEHEKNSIQEEIDKIRIVTEEDLSSIRETIELLEEINKYKGQLEGINKTLVSLNLPEKITEEINILEGEIETDKKNKLDLEQRLDVKRCPCCKASIRISNGDIISSGNDPVDVIQAKIDIKSLGNKVKINIDRIESLKSELFNVKNLNDKKNKIEVELSEYEIDNDISLSEEKKSFDKFKQLRNDRLNLEKKLLNTKNKINNKELSSTLKKLQTQLNTKKVELDKLKSKMENGGLQESRDSEEELQEEISSQSLIGQKLESLTKNIKDYTAQFDKSKRELEKIILTTRNLQGELSDINCEISSLELKNKQHKETSENIQKYQEYKNKLIEYEKWENKLEICKEEEIKSRKILAMSEYFLKKIQEAESICISQTIDTINYYMNFYLDKFFPNNPITVEILPYKETKKDIKPTINIEVSYKGVITDLNSLSGGEYDRVTLSIVLALNTIFGSNLLMLDESISSLDVDLTNDILEVLRESLKDKLVIIVSHQISDGVFDNVINVDEE
jgi:exonuclease SbcC